MKKLFSVVVFLGSGMYLFAQHTLVQQLSAQINQDSLVTYVKQLTGLLPIETPQGNKIITSRLKGSAGNELAAQFIKRKLTGWGVSYDTLDFSSTGQNIIGKIEGIRSGKIMVIGAHYDAVGTSNPEFFYPGADDNASGTAAVLEIARVCAGQQFPVTLHFAFWDEEEQGLVGSRASAVDYMQNKLVGYINLDMIAYDSNNDSSFDIHSNASGYSAEMGKRTFDLIQHYDVPLNPRLIHPGDVSTDHGAFWQNNLTAIGINEEYNGDFTPHWHKLTDSITYFNLSYFTRMSQFAATAFIHFAMDTTNLLALSKTEQTNTLIDVYPNPFNKHIKVSMPEGITLKQAWLYDATGKVVLFQDVESNAIIDMPETLNNGLYYLVIESGNGYFFRKKVMKK